MRVKVTAQDILGKQIAESLRNVNEALQNSVDRTLGDVAQQAFEKAKELADSRLYTTRQQYKNALDYQKIGRNIYAITLDASASHLEEGYDTFDMKPGLLHLGKSIPKATGGTKGIQVSKAGYRYRAIPFEHSNAPANPTHPLHNQPVQIGKPQQTTLGDLMKDAKRLKATADRMAQGYLPKNAQGKIWTALSDPLNRNRVAVRFQGGQQASFDLGKPIDSRLVGMVKMRREITNPKTGKTSTKTAYMTFRMVSENPKYANKWIHPGFKGAKIFPDLQRWAESAFAKMVEEFLQPKP